MNFEKESKKKDRKKLMKKPEWNTCSVNNTRLYGSNSSFKVKFFDLDINSWRRTGNSGES